MAIWKPGPVVSGISGALGGVTFFGGKRSAVIAVRRRRSVNESKEATRRRVGFAFACSMWDAMDSGMRRAWESWAASQAWTNALGMKKNLNGRSAYLAWLMLWDPLMETAQWPMPPPVGLTPAAPVMEPLVWTASSAPIATVSDPLDPPLFLVLQVRRHLELGSRTSVSMTRFIGKRYYDSKSWDWHGRLVARGFSLVAGERVRANLTWARFGLWPSQGAALETVVS